MMLQAELDISDVAARIGVSRTTLYNYDLDQVIQAAAERQQANRGVTGKARERHTLGGRSRSCARS